MDRIAALVRSAVGFDEQRGDNVEVVNLRFAQGPVADLPESEVGLFDFTKDDILYMVELGVIVVISILLLFFVVRPLVRKVVAEEEKEPDALEDGEQQMMTGAEGTLVPVARKATRSTGYSGCLMPRRQARITSSRWRRSARS